MNMKYLLISASYDTQSRHGLLEYKIGIYAPVGLKKSKDLPERVSKFIETKLKKEYEKNGFGCAFMSSWINSVQEINGQDNVVFDIHE